MPETTTATDPSVGQVGVHSGFPEVSAFAPPRQTRVRLRRQVLASAAPPWLDETQRRVVAHESGPLRVLGAPGTGKTTVVVESVVDRVEERGLDPSSVLVLAPTRLAAARLRERVTARLARTVREPLARTPQSFAFGVLREVALRADLPAPRLISGPEQDLILRELLAGHVEGLGSRPSWPTELASAVGTRGFRGQLRDLMMRAVERGVDPTTLRALGKRHGRPEWEAAAAVLQEYLDVTALATPGAFDPASITEAAAQALVEDAELLDQVRRTIRFVAFDDAHEATPAVAELVRVVAGRGGDLLLAGDPDAVTQGFRGADPALLTGDDQGPDDGLALPGTTVPVLRLGIAWRQGPALAEVTARVSERIGAIGGGAHRRLRQPDTEGSLGPGEEPSSRPDGSPLEPAGASSVASDVGADADPRELPVQVHVLRSAVHEGAFIAELLRRRHLHGGVPWSQMAVVVRGTGRAATVRRLLVAAGVPVEVPAAEQPVRDQIAVAPLLDVFGISLALAAGEVAPIDAGAAVELLGSPLGGADPVAMRRLRRALRAQELARGGARASDELLVEALFDPDQLASIERGVAAPALRVSRVLAAGAEAAARPGVNAEELLWRLWQATGLSDGWRRIALAGGVSGARADRDLDAVVALFDAAGRFVDRLPHAGAREFLQHLRGQEVPGDTLVERGAGTEAVSLVTPAGAAGRQWRVVVVAGVQEGVWPDLRLRGSLLGSEALVDVLTERDTSVRAATRAIRDDETRLFLVAVSRAHEMLVVTAVQDEDDQPSALLDLVDARPSDSADRIPTPAPRRLSLPGLVARLRQVVSDPATDPGLASFAATQLARLAAAEVPGAHPDDWYGLSGPSDDQPLGDGVPVRVSPSRVEEFDRCSLRWLLTSAGGRGPSSVAQAMGNLVHELAAELPDADAETLRDELHRRWKRLGLGQSWVGDAGRLRLDRMIDKLAAYLADNRAHWHLVGTEMPFRMEVDLPGGPVLLSGQVDRLEADESGALRVIDLKTGVTPPRAADIVRNPQLGVYQVAVEGGALTGGTPVSSAGAALVQLGSSHTAVKVQPQRALQDDEEPDWALDLLARVGAGMAGDAFPAVVNPVCQHCPVRSSCPAHRDGRRVTE